MKKLAIPLAMTAALAGFGGAAAADEHSVRAVLTTSTVMYDDTEIIQIEGLADAQTCLDLAAIAVMQPKVKISATVSCLQNGEIIAAQACNDAEGCKEIAAARIRPR